jgi:chromosome segregation ATPase
MKAMAYLIVSALASTAVAKTDVNQKLEQLKENRDASAHNLRVVEDGHARVSKQVVEVERALKQIQGQRTAISKQTGAAGATKQKAGEARRQLDAWIVEEERALQVERRQAEELRAALVRLESNQKVREANLATYQEKRKKIGSELEDWSGRNQEVLALDSALQEREAQAKADLLRLTERRTELEREVSKWRQDSRTAEREHENFGALKN